MDNKFRIIPSVDRVILDLRLRPLLEYLSKDIIVIIIREELEKIRNAISNDEICPSYDSIVGLILDKIMLFNQIGTKKIINATGVILHTNLGRAPLSRETIAAMQLVAEGYSNLEFNLADGKRGSRQEHINRLMSMITGSEECFVVNNNAAAVLLALTVLAKKHEVIISRGQAVEIGGKFRIPDVMKQSGAKLIEVGTTNRTYINDYEQAISDKTAILMHVHSSNFKTVGFVHEVDIKEIVQLAAKHNLLVIDDIGSGCFLDTTVYGLDHEPTVQDSIKAGADLVCFSGDKLLGGPQAGILAGKQLLIDKLMRHPLSRAIRIDKFCLTGLGVTLSHYLKDEAVLKIPVWQMISMSVDDIEKRAHSWTNALGQSASVINGQSMIGAGSLPGATLPTKLVAISMESKARFQNLVEKLRSEPPYIVGRIEKDKLLLDPRTVLLDEDATVINVLKRYLNS